VAALLILLIALGALAAGVLVGRYYVPDDRALKRRARHAQHYLKALTHHIARDHDVVVAELRKVVDDNVDDSEPYFALAALFRGRGEHERAVRVHQALAVREGASARLRQRALFELGLDFRAAGMPRRAVKALEQVLADDAGHEGALRALCGLYEEQGRFAEAATAWGRLGKVQGEPPPRRHHHLLCAAAQQAIAAGDLDSAKQLLREAKGGGESPHFFVVAAELAAARGNARGARERLCQALTAAPELVPYLVPGLATADREVAEASGKPAVAGSTGGRRRSGGSPAGGGRGRRRQPGELAPPPAARSRWRRRWRPRPSVRRRGGAAHGRRRRADTCRRLAAARLRCRRRGPRSHRLRALVGALACRRRLALRRLRPSAPPGWRCPACWRWRPRPEVGRDGSPRRPPPRALPILAACPRPGPAV
jgi:tetratricopeptide (TPR) repeat protein